MADGRFVALALKPDALDDDCERAALLVTARQTPPGCGPTVVNLERLRRQGAMALRRTNDGFVVDAVKPRGVNRPWSPAAAGDAETEPTTPAPRSAVPRAVDATPAEIDMQAED
jgi:competence protein ComEC